VRLARQHKNDQSVLDVMQVFDAPSPEATPDADVAALLKQLEPRAGKARGKDEYSGYARPRMLFMPEPRVHGEGAVTQARGLLFSRLLASEIKRHGGVVFANRSNLRYVLKELDMGSSELADERVALHVGKLLPAAILLTTEIIFDGKGELLHWVLEDTETTREFASGVQPTEPSSDLGQLCRAIAAEVRTELQGHKPLEAKVFEQRGKSLEAGVGHFHGADENTVFAIHKRTPVMVNDRQEFREKPVGTAKISELRENSSTLIPLWTQGFDLNDAGILWLRETSSPTE